MKKLYFFIGTEAELMKMFMVIKKARESGFDCKIISSGQNDIYGSPYLALSNSKVDIDLAKHLPTEKTGKEYLSWFIKTQHHGIKILKQLKKEAQNNNIVMVVHGDTLSTLLGSRIARKCDMEYVHVEAGLRSYNWLVPFPEEIDRYFSSKHSAMNFCPKEEYTITAKKIFKGEAVCTYYNTGIETLLYAIKSNHENPQKSIYEGQYFVLAIHRQENLVNKKYMTQLVHNIKKLSCKIHCVFIYHLQTENALKKYGLWDQIVNDKNILILRRLPYLQFIDIIENCEFVIADGAGNQQEFYYMGKPYLIMRTDFEKESEGIGHNAMGFQGNFKNIFWFYQHYKEYKKNAIIPDIMPSDIIVEKLKEKYS